MSAIIDVSTRASRGETLMIVEDLASARQIAVELNRRATIVAVRPFDARPPNQAEPAT